MKQQRLSLFLLLIGIISACGSTSGTQPAASLAPTPGQIAAPVPQTQEIVFMPAEVAQSRRVASLVIAPPRATVADLNDLSKHLKLPMMLGDEAWARLGHLGEPTVAKNLQGLLTRLDSAASLSVVWLLEKKAEGRGYCAALTFPHEQAAKASLPEFGHEVSNQAGISERMGLGGSRLFVASEGPYLLVANTRESLVTGGMLAMSTVRHARRDQLELTLWPKVLVAANETTYDRLAGEVIARLNSEETSRALKTTPASRRLLVAATQMAFHKAAEVDAMKISLNLALPTGLTIKTEVFPTPKSELGRWGAQFEAYSFDPKLPMASDGVTAIASGGKYPFSPDLQTVVRASGPAGEKLAETFQNFFMEKVGKMGCVMEATSKGFSTLCSFNLQSGVSSEQALRSLESYLSAQNAWMGELEGRTATPLRVKNAKNTLTYEQKIESNEKLSREMLKEIFGGDFMYGRAEVKGDRLLLAQGKKAALVSTLKKEASAGKLPPIFSQTLEHTAGAGILCFGDPLAILLHLIPKSLGKEVGPYRAVLASLPGIQDLHLPLIFSVRGGSTWTGEFQIPLGSLESLAKILAGLMGAPPTQ